MGYKQYESDSFKKTGGTSSQYLMADGSVSTGPSGGVDVGTGTANKVAKFSDSDTITDSTITDDGTNVSMTGSITAPKLILGSSGNGYLEDDELIKVYGDQGILLESGDAVTITINEQIEIESGNLISDSNITAASLIKSGGTSSQFLKANGSVDSNSYALTSAIPTNTSFVDLTTAQSIAGIKTFQDDVEMYEGKKLILDIDGDGFCSIKFDNIGGNVIYESSGSHHFKNGEVDTYEALVAGSFIKSGGTSSQFLKADGSVDSSTYSTTDTQLTTEQVQDIVGAMVQSNTEQSISVTYSDGDGKLNFDAGAAVYEHPGETAFTEAVDTGALTGAVVVSDIDMNISTNAFGHVTSAGMAVATRTLTLADLGFTGDADATNDQVLPTDFVSASAGGTFGGDIIADSFAVPGGSSTRFLKADGSTDSNTYVTGSGSSGNIAIFDTTNGLIDTSSLAWDALNDSLDVDGDLDVTGYMKADIIEAAGWTYVPQTFQSNFVHSTGNSYMNVPFNSLTDASSGGEQHFLVTPYSGYVHSVAFKNTATGTTMTATNMNFRVLVNGITQHTSNTQSFTAASRTYKGWVLTSTNATFNAGDDLRFQFRCTSGFWQDTCAVVVLKCVI